MTSIGAVRVPRTSFFDSPLGKTTEVVGGLAAGGGIAFGIAKLLGKSTGSAWRVAGVFGALAGVGMLLAGCGNTGGQAPSHPTNPAPAPLPPAPVPVPAPAPSGGGTSPGDDPIVTGPGSGGTSPGDDPVVTGPGSGGTSPGDDPVVTGPGTGGTSPGDDGGVVIDPYPTSPGDDSGIGNPPFDAPDGATAECNDGTYSYAQQHSGACSHHGGVAVWYR